MKLLFCLANTGQGKEKQRTSIEHILVLTDELKLNSITKQDVVIWLGQCYVIE